MAKKKTPFDMFKEHEVKTAKIKALGDAEVKYRELLMAEDDDFKERASSLFDFDTNTPKDGAVAKLNELNYEKVSMMLVEPAMTVEEIKNLPATSRPAIEEILALSGIDDEIVDKEGN